MRDCEIIVKIICHASTLQSDDCKYKRQTNVNKMCNMCYNYEIEDARHLILRCSHFQVERDAMFREIEDGSSALFFENSTDMFYTLLGKSHENLSDAKKERIWLIFLIFVSTIYRKNLKYKSGIG